MNLFPFRQRPDFAPFAGRVRHRGGRGGRLPLFLLPGEGETVLLPYSGNRGRAIVLVRPHLPFRHVFYPGKGKR